MSFAMPQLAYADNTGVSKLNIQILLYPLTTMILLPSIAQLYTMEREDGLLHAMELASMLYTYRSIARALPTVTGTDAHKKAMYAASFEVLHPHFGASKAAHLLAAG